MKLQSNKIDLTEVWLVLYINEWLFLFFDLFCSNNEKMRGLIHPVIIVCMFLAPKLIFGWGQTGHRVVGQVAMNHMTKKANKNIL